MFNLDRTALYHQCRNPVSVLKYHKGMLRRYCVMHHHSLLAKYDSFYFRMRCYNCLQHMLLSRKNCYLGFRSGLEVIKLEYSLKLKIKRNDWLLADTCPKAANHCALL